MHTLTIIIPCHNEEKRLDQVAFVRFAVQNSNFLIVFVDDGSTDGTLAVLNQIHQQAKSNTRILAIENNIGKGPAIRQAMLEITGSSNPDFIGYLDADLSTPLNEFEKLFHSIQPGHYDFVLGSRIKKIDTDIQRSYFRHFTGRIIATAIDEKFQLGCYDTQCGAKIFRTQVLKNIIQEPFFTKWFFDVEILLRIRKENGALKGSEYPLSVWRHIKDSKINLFSFPVVIKELIQLFLKY